MSAIVHRIYATKKAFKIKADFLVLGIGSFEEHSPIAQRRLKISCDPPL